MNADEVVRALRNCKAYKTKSDLQITMIRAADLIESQQAEIRAAKDAARAAQDANSEAGNTITALRAETYFLQAQLAASQRRERAAVKELKRFRCRTCYMGDKKHLSDGSMDHLCLTCQRNDMCNWQWRGPQEAGKERRNE